MYCTINKKKLNGPIFRLNLCKRLVEKRVKLEIFLVARQRVEQMFMFMST